MRRAKRSRKPRPLNLLETTDTTLKPTSTIVPKLPTPLYMITRQQKAEQFRQMLLKDLKVQAESDGVVYLEKDGKLDLKPFIECYTRTRKTAVYELLAKISMLDKVTLATVTEVAQAVLAEIAKEDKAF